MWAKVMAQQSQCFAASVLYLVHRSRELSLEECGEVFGKRYWTVSLLAPRYFERTAKHEDSELTNKRALHGPNPAITICRSARREPMRRPSGWNRQ